MKTPIRIQRSQQQREDGLSQTLQISKASEHLVCCELILRGWNAFIPDAGLPYDVIVDLGNGKMCRIQVKTTTRMYQRNLKSKGKSKQPHYRFSLKQSRTGKRSVDSSLCDYVALVALDRKLIAWMSVEYLESKTGKVPMLIEMKTRQIDYIRQGKRGTLPKNSGKFIEDFDTFSPYE